MFSASAFSSFAFSSEGVTQLPPIVLLSGSPSTITFSFSFNTSIYKLTTLSVRKSVDSYSAILTVPGITDYSALYALIGSTITVSATANYTYATSQTVPIGEFIVDGVDYLMDISGGYVTVRASGLQDDFRVGSITLRKPSYYSSRGGERYRCEIEPGLKPGDTVTYSDISFTADSITITCNNNIAQMEVSSNG